MNDKKNKGGKRNLGLGLVSGDEEGREEDEELRRETRRLNSAKHHKNILHRTQKILYPIPYTIILILLQIN
jgi:hypothetical protein